MRFRCCLAALLVTALAACSKGGSASAMQEPERPPPHGGTPVVLGHEAYLLEFVRDAGAGRLDAYVLDGEREDFIRVSDPSFEIVATVGEERHPLLLKAVANPATGETVGGTSQFQAQADWLKSADSFDAVLTEIRIRGAIFSGVQFNFPRGNGGD